MKRLVVGTRSDHKLEEIRNILGRTLGVDVVGLEEAGVPYHPDEETLEPFDTFEENARSKAEYFFRIVGEPVVADDSGIVVDALGGAPGVRSKRFASDEGVDVGSFDSVDEANNRRLVQRLASVPPAERTARYVCVAVLVDGTEEPVVVRGEAEGLVSTAPRGVGGFGYDPYIVDPESGRTFAELAPAEKDARSHRGKAFRALVEAMAGRL